MGELGRIGPDIAAFVFLAIGAIALFTFLSVATWAGTRQAEREAYFKSEMLKKIAEIGGERSPALDYLREQERIAAAKRIGGLKLSGLVNIGVGLGLMIFLDTVARRLAPVGAIPLFVGAALLIYALWFAPRQPVSGASDPSQV